MDRDRRRRFGKSPEQSVIVQFPSGQNRPVGSTVTAWPLSAFSTLVHAMDGVHASDVSPVRVMNTQ